MVTINHICLPSLGCRPYADRWNAARSCQYFCHLTSLNWLIKLNNCCDKYKPSGEGSTRSPPAKSEMAAKGGQNGRQSLEKCLPSSFWVLRSTFAK